jgi:hypothetical protein
LLSIPNGDTDRWPPHGDRGRAALRLQQDQDSHRRHHAG